MWAALGAWMSRTPSPPDFAPPAGKGREGTAGRPCPAECAHKQPLGWFRSDNGKFTWLAFFALTCQFVLTFGHVHFASVSVLSAAIVSSADPAADPTATQTLPTQQTPAGLAQDFCAVCKNIGLANTLILPASPDSVSRIPISAHLQGVAGDHRA